MKLKKLKLYNFRCFGNQEQSIDIDDITAFIGSNSAGKTAALAALNCLFSENGADRVLKRSDFHLPKGKTPEEQDRQDMYIETVFEFESLSDEGDTDNYAIPVFFQSMVVDGPQKTPYLRIRLEATWERSNSIEGAIDNKIYYVTAPENSGIISDNEKRPASRKELDQIRVLYVPAVRDPSKQLRNSSGSMLYQMMNCISWSEATRESVKLKIEELNEKFLEESGVAILNQSIQSQWQLYDSDERYSNAFLKFNGTEMESVVKKTQIYFSPTVTGKEYSIDELGDGLRSLFYISLVNSILEVELRIREEEKAGKNVSFDRRPPVLTIIALEEPENHISPHLIGKLMANLFSIAQKCNAQTILSSHSPAIVKRMDPKNLRYFRMDEKEGATMVRRILLPDEETLADQLKYIKEAVKAYPELYFAKLVILGEGDSEGVLLPKFWQAKHRGLDESGISVIPLGGRHVNHFWRLLNDLKIPHITLLDLDREREGGGWGRIKYVVEQLLKIGHTREELLKTEDGLMSEQELEKMDGWDVTDVENMNLWIKFLEKYHVYFSAPLDIDFMMLEHYGEKYKGLLRSTEGPRFMEGSGDNTQQKMVLDAEKGEMTEAYAKRISEGIRTTLKECGGEGDTFSEEQKKLMVWYSYFFLQRGKPSTHMELMSNISDADLIKHTPDVFKRLYKDAEKMLQ